MTDIISRVRVDDQITWKLWEKFPMETTEIVISFQDFLTSKKHNFNTLFYKVKEAGGLHKFMKYKGKIILSFIIKDSMLAKLSLQDYVSAIEALIPSKLTAVDCETYQTKVYTSKGIIYYDGDKLSEEQIIKSFEKTRELKRLFPKHEMIGLAKGCNRRQILWSLNLQKSIGINNFILHVGDFFRNGNKNMINQAKTYAEIIKRNSDKLYLYGMGSQKRLTEFSFADYYITFNHYVKATKGVYYQGTKSFWTRFIPWKKIFFWNFYQILKNMKRMNTQKKLTEYMKEEKWVEESEQITEQPIQTM